MVGLGLGLGLGLGQNVAATSGRSPLCEAIHRKVCVSAERKNKQLLLAPHVVYTDADAQYLDAVVVAENGKKPNKAKIATYAVADLASVAITDTTFKPNTGFKPNDPKYAGKTVCVVEMV
jgi:hypothetical protein